MNLYENLKQAKSEEDVKDIYQDARLTTYKSHLMSLHHYPADLPLLRVHLNHSKLHPLKFYSVTTRELQINFLVILIIALNVGTISNQLI